MGFLGWADGSPTWMMSYELDSFGDTVVTLDVAWIGGPGAAQASLNHYNPGQDPSYSAAATWVEEANGDIYMLPAVYRKDMTQVTFAVVTGSPDSYATALLNIYGFAAGALIVETALAPYAVYPGGY